MLMRWLTRCGFPGRTPTSLSRARRQKYPLSRQVGWLSPSGLISRSVGIEGGSRSATSAFAEVVVPAGATRGIASGWASGWALLDDNREDPVELTLASDLHKSVLSHVAESSCGKYTCQLSMFVAWCDTLAEPRASLPASDDTVALCMQFVMNGAKIFAPVKVAFAAVAFYQKINLFDHEPTQSPAVCLVRGAAMRKFGLNPKSRKDPFEWEQAVSFVEAYGVRHQGYYHPVVRRRVRHAMAERPLRGGWERIRAILRQAQECAIPKR